MNIEIIDQLVPKNDGYFGVLQDGYLIGGYRSVKDVAARDLIPASRRVAGMRVKTLSDGRDWILGSGLSNGEWFLTSVMGNQALLAILNDPSVILDLFVSAIGNDTTATGRTTNSPFATIQRAFDEVPDGAQGHVRINLLGAGPFENFHARNYLSPTHLEFYVIGDTTAPTHSWGSIGIGTNPVNPTGGNKHAVFEYNVGAYSPAFGDGTHWVMVGTIGGGTFASFGNGTPKLIDGYASASPTVRFVEQFASTDAASNAYAFTSIIDNSGWGLKSEPINTFGFNFVSVVGCIVGQLFGEYPRNVSFFACKFPEGFYDTGSENCIAASCWFGSSFQPTVAIDARVSSATITGIFNGGVQYAAGFGGISGVFRGIDSDNFALKLGSHIGTTGTAASGSELDCCDFEMPFGSCIHMNWANARFCNGDGMSCTGSQSNFLTISNHSFAEINARIYGSIAGIPFVISNMSNVTGLGDFASGAPLIHNNLVAGSNVQVGALSAVNYSALPKTDLSAGNTSQICRAE
jgi:hypothetical protein